MPAQLQIFISHNFVQTPRMLLDDRGWTRIMAWSSCKALFTNQYRLPKEFSVPAQMEMAFLIGVPPILLSQDLEKPLLWSCL